MNPVKSSTLNHDLSENVAYNTPAFPAYIREGFLSLYPDYTAASHWHEDLEFIVVLKGSMTYNVNGQLIPLTAGKGILVNSRQLHYGFSSERHDCDFVCILLHPSLLSANPYFTDKFIEPFIRNIDCPYVFLDPTVSWNHDILKMLKDIFHTASKERSPFTIQRHFFHIMELLFTNLTPSLPVKSRSSAQLTMLKTMLLYINEHYSEKLTLSDIAKSGSCCKSKCSELFRQYLKDSPITFLNKYRLKTSCDLLRNTALSITEISFECGYHGTSYFCESFRKYYGITPLQYRKLHKQESSY